MLLELAVFHPDSVYMAARCGVDRLELCRDYSAGGLSPEMEFFSLARKRFSGGIFVMIRPRPGNFVYNREELLWMQAAMRRYHSAGADGFVLGCLREKTVDAGALDLLVDTAGKTPVTFHRAIDEVEDFQRGIQTLIKSGCRRVLSSGKAATAQKGSEALKEMTEKFGQQIGFLAGGGIRSSNIGIFKQIKGLGEVHTAAISGSGEVADETEILRLMAEISS